MTKQQLIEIREFMSKHKDNVYSVSDLVEDTVKALELENDLTDEKSPIWHIAQRYISEE